MSVHLARKYLRTVKWREFFGVNKSTVRRGAYKFRGYIGIRYGRNAVWVTNYGKDVFLQFVPGEKFPWKEWSLYGGWMGPDQFKKLTGIDPLTPVVKGSD